MSMDSLSPFGKGGFNGYIFASNNPVMYQDPSGHTAQSVVGAVMTGITLVLSLLFIFSLPFSPAAAIGVGMAISGNLSVGSQVAGANGQEESSKALGIISGVIGVGTGIASAAVGVMGAGVGIAIGAAAVSSFCSDSDFGCRRGGVRYDECSVLLWVCVGTNSWVCGRACGKRGC